LTHDRARLRGAARKILKGLPDFNRQDFEGQDKRAAGRFALLALAGELATEYGLTGWPEGEAIKAAAIGFNAWRSLRGRGNDERRQILQKVSDFIERHGDARFSNATPSEKTNARPGRLVARRQRGELYLFTAEGMREALKGFDFARALDELEAVRRASQAGADGKRARFVSHRRAPMKLYPIAFDRLEAG
jgi:putative DNA primase/helicase